MTKYKKTKKGVISVIYSSQILNSKKRGHNPPDYTKLEFSNWVYDQSDFEKLYKKWVKSNYRKELKPSVDRLNDYEGYSMDNIQLMTWGENKAKGHRDRKQGINNKRSVKVIQIDKKGDFVREWYSMMEAEREGFDSGHISKCCKNQRKTHGGYTWEYKEVI